METEWLRGREETSQSGGSQVTPCAARKLIGVNDGVICTIAVAPDPRSLDPLSGLWAICCPLSAALLAAIDAHVDCVARITTNYMRCA